jgi:hypothetical protein
MAPGPRFRNIYSIRTVRSVAQSYSPSSQQSWLLNQRPLEVSMRLAACRDRPPSTEDRNRGLICRILLKNRPHVLRNEGDITISPFLSASFGPCQD